MDHFIKQDFKAKAYLLYCDDFAVFSDDERRAKADPGATRRLSGLTVEAETASSQDQNPSGKGRYRFPGLRYFPHLSTGFKTSSFALSTTLHWF
ncbi:MAG: hypothetical protein QGH37_19445 [Candidatus Poribacteria bacterium]|jgi:hypothetical protein|nr:hypothetical protein [Candidatus Poribacteria bacterium]MDP6960974.1 hypothetical protein [Dehalococcoidia bacterium]